MRNTITRVQQLGEELLHLLASLRLRHTNAPLHVRHAILTSGYPKRRAVAENTQPSLYITYPNPSILAVYPCITVPIQG